MKFVIEEVAFGEASLSLHQFSPTITFLPNFLTDPYLNTALIRKKMGRMHKTFKEIDAN